MASRQLEESIETIDSRWRAALDDDLVLGGTNHHEDLHFSTFYLRASLADAAQPRYIGYSAIIALFERGCETYYVPRREAERTALSIIDRALRRPQWLPLVLERIERLSLKVGTALEDAVAGGLAKQPTGRLLQAYERHNRLHSELYRLARLPEALDRGSPWFTDYLLECLRGRSVREDDLFLVFDSMTRPRAPSIVSEAEASFQAIAQAADVGHGSKDGALSLMSLSPAVREALAAHAERWEYLYYHGYRNRRLPSLAEHAQRLARAANGDKGVSSSPGLSGARDVPIPILDEPHAALFAAYAEIGRVKLARRYAQLKNFYFLDQLLAEFSRRLGVSEWEVRCGMPEEVSQALRAGAWPDTVSTRCDGCAVLFTPGREDVLSGGLMKQLRTELRMAERARPHPRIRRGTPACLGFAEGRARLLPAAAPIERFDEGDVLIADTIDPDLLPIILKASAVVTQQGGVGSHAAVLCRELGIPTIVGISDLLDFCSDGEVLRIDATKGTIERCDPVVDSILVGCGNGGDTIGRKAANLRRAEGVGIRVPPYRLLSWDQLLHQSGASEKERARAIQRLALGLAPPNEGVPDYILRSSALDEDVGCATVSRSYQSVPFKLEESSAALARFIAANEPRGYQGVVILQRFLPASACGIWLDIPEGGGLDEAVVEAVAGPFNIVTSGTGEVIRFRVGRQGELSADGAHLPGLPLENLAAWIQELRSHFPGLLCVEWGFLGEDFWLYQARQLRVP